MIRKVFITGTLALGMALAAVQGAPGIHRLTTSVRSFQQNFHNLKSATSLNSVERIVFSLVLANTEAPQSAK